jgi:glucose/mannose-6-phosphate isomerase
MRKPDRESTYREIDTTDMRARLGDFPAQCERAWNEVLGFKLPSDYRRVDKVVVLGMGGSAIGGDLLAGLASLEETPPIVTSREYDLPPYVDKDTLVLACSYSGNTHETLSAFRQAVARDAKVVVVTSGGTLAQEAKAQGLPAFTINYEGEPRAALGYLFLAPLGILQSLGIVKGKSRAVAQAVKRLREVHAEWCEAVPTGENPAKELAYDLLGRLVVVYGSGAFGAVARRWKTQLNENSKVWAFWETLPELHHNSVVGYPLPKKLLPMTAAVLVKQPGIHPQLERRYDITCHLLDEEGVPSYVVSIDGPTPLCQMLTGVYFGDYVSYYLAILQDVDPSPVPPINYIKSQLT